MSMIWTVAILNAPLPLVMVFGSCLPSSLAQPSDSPQSFFSVNAKREWLLYLKSSRSSWSREPNQRKRECHIRHLKRQMCRFRNDDGFKLKPLCVSLQASKVYAEQLKDCQGDFRTFLKSAQVARRGLVFLLKASRNGWCLTLRFAPRCSVWR